MSKYIPPHMRNQAQAQAQAQAQDKPRNIIPPQKQIKEPVVNLTKNDFPLIGKPVTKTTIKNEWLGVVNKCLVEDKKEEEKKIKEMQKLLAEKKQATELNKNELKPIEFVFIPPHCKSKITLEQELDPFDETLDHFQYSDEDIYLDEEMYLDEEY